ncbi:EAL domain-containing response regulator [Marinobacter sp. SS13-12]|uniref:EAL domain-containing response regulator n=1 Tax=Marinobacter sp. SS13-12 TaxID=3050451 RepID=UPI00255289B3|nr:EAL domain-containing response regulator [Marinobacter sp. SS13-12]MDK8465903.1 EAL domain-containing response regulator [Marinobacter sp. SS13-12]
MMQDSKVLILEDDQFQVKYFRKALEKVGIEQVWEAADGRQALDLLKEVEPDIIFCDLKMEGMDGVEFIRHASQQGIFSSLVFTSALDAGIVSSVESMARSYGFTVLGKLEKPVELEALKKILAASEDQARTAVLEDAEIFTFDQIISALENDEITPWFQPKVGFDDGDWVGSEALARWDSPTHGMINPASFIPLLETVSEIDLLMAAIFEKSVRQCKAWLNIGKRVNVAVNFSVRNLTDIDLPKRIMGLLDWYGVPPELITVEVTESAVSSDTKKVTECLARLRMNGVNVSIDDFGTGFSSIQQLSKIPFNELKIDLSFVQDSVSNPNARAIVESNISLARQFKMKTVAEGVETKEQWDLMKSMGVDICQGFYTGRPMKGKDSIEWYLNR